ncbi:MAG: YraN family protein [Methylophaga sp.]|nr:YraN family protein [Methylophaga sp.]
MNNLGKQAEELASQYLQKQNLTLIDQNYHCRRGEIDLIMQDQHTLVFVEVRYRKNARFGSALESINHKKQAKIITTAEHYLLQSKDDYFDCRFDVIAIMPIHNSDKPEITWIKNAFQLN